MPQDRISLQYLDYDTDAIKASTDSMNSKFNFNSTTPIEQENYQVHAIHVVSEEDSTELLSLVTAVSEAFESHSFSRTYDFEPKGCEWKVTLEDIGKKAGGLRAFVITRDEDTNHWIHCIVIQEKDSHEAIYNVELSLMTPIKGTIGSSSANRSATKAFESLKHIMRKALSRLEFPKFIAGSTGESFRSFYQLNQELNEGSFGVVFRGRNRKTDDVVAVKSVNCKKLSAQDDAAIFTEVALMTNMDHPYIIKVLDFFEEQGHYLMVLEYLEGGDLFDRIGKKSAYSEEDARCCSKILISAIFYCHSNNVAHLDLKSKNLVLTSPDDDTKVKLIDFGFAQRVTGPNCLTRRCGTPYFVAPEIIRKEAYDERADMWSVGVIIYLLLSGHLPFGGRNAMDLFKNVLKGELTFEESNWNSVSPEAKDLVKHLLDTNPETRWTSERAETCDWMRDDAEELKTHDLYASCSKLKTFNAKMKLRASVHAIGFANALGKGMLFKLDGDKSDTVIEEEDLDTQLDD